MGEKDGGELIGGNLEAECHTVLLLDRAAAHPRNRAARTKAMAEGYSAWSVRELCLASNTLARHSSQVVG